MDECHQTFSRWTRRSQEGLHGDIGTWRTSVHALDVHVSGLDVWDTGGYGLGHGKDKAMVRWSGGTMSGHSLFEDKAETRMTETHYMTRDVVTVTTCAWLLHCYLGPMPPARCA